MIGPSKNFYKSGQFGSVWTLLLGMLCWRRPGDTVGPPCRLPLRPNRPIIDSILPKFSDHSFFNRQLYKELPEDYRIERVYYTTTRLRAVINDYPPKTLFLSVIFQPNYIKVMEKHTILELKSIENALINCELRCTYLLLQQPPVYWSGWSLCFWWVSCRELWQ